MNWESGPLPSSISWNDATRLTWTLLKLVFIWSVPRDHMDLEHRGTPPNLNRLQLFYGFLGSYDNPTTIQSLISSTVWIPHTYHTYIYIYTWLYDWKRLYPWYLYILHIVYSIKPGLIDLGWWVWGVTRKQRSSANKHPPETMVDLGNLDILGSIQWACLILGWWDYTYIYIYTYIIYYITIYNYIYIYIFWFDPVYIHICSYTYILYIHIFISTYPMLYDIHWIIYLSIL